MPAGQLSVQHLYGILSRDGFELSQISGILDRDRMVEGLSWQRLPILVIVEAGEQKLEQLRKIPVSSGSAVVLPNSEAESWRWTAAGGQRHRLLTVKWSAEAYRKFVHIAPTPLRGGEGPEVIAASPALLALMQALASPPPHLACLPVWYQAKIMEVAALALFSYSEDASKKTAQSIHRERVERAMYLLERDLQNPPTLEMLAHEVGCGLFQLSRIFKEYSGRTIPEFLRKKRIGQAAESLIKTQRSISDIVLDVGYESFSAFTRAFVREFTITPSQYRAKARGTGRS